MWFSVPADGVKGKTWGPSTLHQKERGHIMLPTAKNSAVWSKSAPNLDKRPSPGGGRNSSNEIGNVSPTLSTKSAYSRGLKLFHKMTANFTSMSRGNSRNNSIAAATANDGEELIVRDGSNRLYANNRLSRSIGNVSDTSHYDTVYSLSRYVIATGKTNLIGGSSFDLAGSRNLNEWVFHWGQMVPVPLQFIFGRNIFRGAVQFCSTM